MRHRVLLADDESSVRLALRKIIEDQGCDVTPVADGQAALDALGRGGYHLVVTDLRMPGADGMQVVRAATEGVPPTPVVVLTGYGTVQFAVEAMRLGAVDFLTKPFEIIDVELTVRRALGMPAKRRAEPKRAEARPAEVKLATALIGESPALTALRGLVTQIADSELTVLLGGESGTGKEVVAHLIHDGSGRRGGPFIPVNCAAIPEPLLESELFGHARGSFTGATQARTGRFTLAAGGTLFLDEIGDMPLALQAKVLRVLQDREITPVGAAQASRVDVRIIAATNRDLLVLVREGRFREDLYYRLNVIPITLPPLRDHPEDIALLCQHFLLRAAARRGRGPVQLSAVLSAGALERMRHHLWPGNVRELENFIERVLVLRRDGKALEAEELPSLLAGTGGTSRDSRPLRLVDSGYPDGNGAYASAETRGRPASGLSSKVALPAGGLDLRAVLSALERQYIREALKRANGNKGEAARMLRLNRTTLVEKLKRLALEEQRRRDARSTKGEDDAEASAALSSSEAGDRSAATEDDVLDAALDAAGPDEEG